MARQALDGVGDEDLGQWSFAGIKPGVYHVIRRMTQEERDEFGVPEPYDIRGTEEEQRRIRLSLATSPLRGLSSSP